MSLEMFEIEFNSGIPVYRQIINAILTSISSGSMGLGDQLPTIRSLAQQLNINPNTVAKAYRELELTGIIESMGRLIDKIPESNPEFDGKNPDPSISSAPYRIFNIGNHSPVNLMDFIRIIEKEAGRKAIINFMPIQPGDVPASHADVTSLINTIDFKPNTSIEVGVRNYVVWFKDYYDIS